jgi:glycosyltransferase involved in cell wall biosynthesis
MKRRDREEISTVSGALEDMPKVIPRVSMGLAVYNGERFLEEALTSLLAQDFDDFEIVISDNASEDRTPDLCRDFQASDARIAYHRQDENRGAAWNYNHVFALSRGHYFKWTAHDDVYRPTFVSRCVAVLDERPDVSLCYSATADVDDDSRIIHTHPAHPYADADDVVGRVGSLLAYRSSCIESFGLVRREHMARTGLIGPYTSSDRTWMLELALMGKFHEIPEVLFLHRQHAGRSMKRHRDPVDRLAWFDPKLAGRISLPRWRLLVEYARSIARASISPSEKLGCLAHLGRWTGVNATGLLRDLAACVRYAGRSLQQATR